jgi:hypothetical protein
MAMQYFNPKCIEILPLDLKENIISSIELINSFNISCEPDLNHREKNYTDYKNYQKWFQSIYYRSSHRGSLYKKISWLKFPVALEIIFFLSYIDVKIISFWE